MKAITTRLKDNLIKQLGIFGSNYNAVQIATEGFFILRRFAQQEIKGIFNHEEWYALIDMHNGTIFEPKMAQKAVLLGKAEDSELYEGTITKHGADKKKFFAKIKNLRETQAFFITLECYLFWYENSEKEKNLEEFVEKYL